MMNPGDELLNFWRLEQREAIEKHRVLKFGTCKFSLPNRSHCAFGYALMEDKRSVFLGNFVFN